MQSMNFLDAILKLVTPPGAMCIQYLDFYNINTSSTTAAKIHNLLELFSL